MTRKKLIKKICKEVLNDGKLSIQKMQSCTECHREKYKSGLYFLYNNKKKCIYVGMVGNGNNVSLYMRMIGNGSGSHATKDSRWYFHVAYGYWHKFDLSDSELATLERLAIVGMKQPIYNDKDTDHITIDSLCEKLGY